MAVRYLGSNAIPQDPALAVLNDGYAESSVLCRRIRIMEFWRAPSHDHRSWCSTQVGSP
jgi:hypothetical protein